MKKGAMNQTSRAATDRQNCSGIALLISHSTPEGDV